MRQLQIEISEGNKAFLSVWSFLSSRRLAARKLVTYLGFDDEDGGGDRLFRPPPLPPHHLPRSSTLDSKATSARIASRLSKKKHILQKPPHIKGWHEVLVASVRTAMQNEQSDINVPLLATSNTLYELYCGE